MVNALTRRLTVVTIGAMNLAHHPLDQVQAVVVGRPPICGDEGGPGQSASYALRIISRTAATRFGIRLAKRQSSSCFNSACVNRRGTRAPRFCSSASFFGISISKHNPALHTLKASKRTITLP